MPRSGDRFLAIDWGTTNRRVYVIDEGRVTAVHRDDRGVLAVGAGGFEAEVDAMRRDLGEAPMLLAGMVGSNRGWVDAGYVPTPATFEALAERAVRPREGAVIVPGVSHIRGRRGDVMRGEEVQLLGAVAAGLAPKDALLCQPGTHCKWARMNDGAIAGFVTAMTGELFALLKAHALIGGEMSGEVTDNAAFAEGVSDSEDGDLLSALFSVRPAKLLDLRPPGEAASYVSGLLIGADARAHRRESGEVYLLAGPLLGALYARAIAMTGGKAHRVDSEAAFVAGACKIQELLQ